MRTKSKTLYLILNSVKNLLALIIIIAVFCLILPGRAEAAIAVDNASSNTGTSDPITVSHTTSGENRLMLVGIYGDAGTLAITSVKYNNVDLSFVGSEIKSALHLYIYSLVAPDTGTNDLVVDFDGDPSYGGIVGVVTFTGVDQSTPSGFVSDQGESDEATIAASSAPGEVVFAALATRAAVAMVGADQVEHWNAVSSDETGAGSTEPGAASVTMSWDFSAEHWCIGAVPIKPAAEIFPAPPNIPTLLRIFDNAIYNAWYEGVSTYECTLSVVATDPEGDNIQYEIQWDTNYGFASPSSETTSYYSSGVEAKTTIDLDQVDPEQVYYWKTRAMITAADWQYRKKITIDHTKVGVITPAPWYNTDWYYRNKITIDYTKVGEAPWYNADWQYRNKITIDSTKVPNTNQTNFPVLINRTDTDWKVTGSGGHVGQSDGGDILFTSSDGTTKLDHEIEKYDSLTGSLIAWVEVDTVSASTDTDIYIYYGNATAADQWNITGTWDEGGDNNYEAVWHMNETTGGTGAIKDATSNNNDGTDEGTPTFEATGKIGNAISFDALADLIDCGDIDEIDGISKMTWEAWVKPSSLADYQAALAKDNGSKNVMWLGSSGSGQGGNDDVAFGVENGSLNIFAYSTSNPLNTTNWHYLTGWFDGTQASAYDRGQVYHNGVNVKADGWNDAHWPTTTPSGTGTFDIGTDGPQGTEYWRGIIDEVRISNVARSADWIATSYNNQNSPSTFYSVGITEEQALTNFPILINRTDTDWKVTGSGGHVGQSDGGDILFTLSDGTTQLDHEIEEYDSLTGELIAWVEVDTVSALTDTDIYIYYGNATVADQWNVSGTWDEGGDNNFKAVWHLNETTGGAGAIKDATSNNNDGTDGGSPGLGVTGAIANAIDFDGDDDLVNLPVIAVGNKATLAAWVQNDDATGGYIGGNWCALGRYWVEYALRIKDGRWYGCWNDVCAYDADVYADSNWHLEVVTYDNSLGSENIKLYVDGIEIATADETGATTREDKIWQIGTHGNNAYYWDGTIDEVRISSVARTANWIATCYNNQNSPSTFYSVGITEEQALTNFPVLINRTDTDWKYGNGGHVGQSDGGDILFTSSDGTTQLDHEIEEYVPSAGSLIAWVEVDTVSALTDTDIYIYYGNATVADQWNVSGTWDEGGDNNFKAVWHLSETTGGTGAIKDATQYGNHGTDGGSPGLGVTGKIGNAVEFYADDEYIDCGSDESLEMVDNLTVSLWFKTSESIDNDGLITKMDNNHIKGWLMYFEDNAHPGIFTGDGTGFEVTYCDSLNTNDGNWHQIVYKYDGTTAYMWFDGVEQEDSDTVTMVGDTNVDVEIGRKYSGTAAWEFDGIIDEVRISSTARSANWIATCYNNQNSPSTFYSVDAEEGCDNSSWSGIKSFTMDMELGDEWPYWYQVAGAQFEQCTKEDVEVVGNTVKLVSPYTTGTLTSPPIVYDDLKTEDSDRSHWDGAKWTKSSAADSIGLQIEYKDGGTWSLVPEDTIPGNLNGFFFPTAFCYIDFSSISTSIYDTLRMKATFKSYTAKSASDPALLMWALGNQSSIVTGISTIDKPMVFALYRNRPNPFTNGTEIRYQIPKRVKVELQVFDVIGRSVVTLVNKEQKPGYYSIQWKGMNKNKKLLPSGVYFLRMEAGDFKATQKMVRLR